MPEINIYQGDCLELMPKIEDKSIDMILADLPYGITDCKWDTVIPFEPLWKQYKRIIKDNRAIVLFGSEPFSSYLRMSNIKQYKYDWIWNRIVPSGFLNVNKMPMKKHEIISIFYKKNSVYNKQMKPRDKNAHSLGKEINYKKNRGLSSTKVYSEIKNKKIINYDKYMKNPDTILEISKGNNRHNIHPTQKPVELMEYLIKTYTNEGDLVLDNVMGSGTTGIACINLNRNFIGMELDKEYFEIAKKRIDNHKTQLQLYE